MAKNKHGKLRKNTIEAARLAEIIDKAGYISRKQLYLQNFYRGIFFGFGSLIGASLILAVILWVLSLFETIPLVGQFVENARQTIQE